MFVKFSKDYMKLLMKNININGLIQHSNHLSSFKTFCYSPSSQYLERRIKSYIMFHEQPRAIERFRDFMVLLWPLSLAIILKV